MSTREASATIKGYYYQFDLSILSLLDLLADNDSIVIEGIEDIDIHTATDRIAVQCKYLSKPKFINSAVREPIILMLDHFVNNNNNNNNKLNYTLYVHFEEETGGNEQLVSLSRLKEILTYTEAKVSKNYYIEHKITDSQLTDFLVQFKFIFGKEFEVQHAELLKKLKLKFNCTDFEADAFYYNNALRIIIDKAIIKDISKRSITKSEFITAINKSKQIFNEWYIRLRSKKEFLKQVSDVIKTTGSQNASKIKYVFIGQNILNADNSEYPILSFVENVINIYYRMNHCLRTSKPITFILELDKALIVDLKISLIRNQISFNDGFEEISFSHEFFNADPIVNLSKNSSRILRSSYSVKVISEATFRQSVNLIHKPKVLFHFSNKECPIPQAPDYQIFDIKYCENLKDIALLLTT